MARQKKQQPTQQDAEGEETTIITAGGSTLPQAITPQRAHKYLKNIHLSTQIENLRVQVFPERPAVWVEDENGEHDEELTKWIKSAFERCRIYPAMMITWYECLTYGASVKSIGYKRNGGRLELDEVRNLPAFSFSQYPSRGDVQNELMQGIVIVGDAVEVWQTQTAGGAMQQTRITNATIITDPTAPQPAGEAYAAPVYPVIAAIDFANKAIDQQVNRVGAPSIFPMLENTTPNLEKWAKKFVKEWGKNTSFVIPQGVSFPDVKIRESQTAAARVEMLIKWIESYFNPTTVLKKGDNQIGASDKGAAQIWANYIGGQQAWIEEAFEDIFKPLMDANGYEKKFIRIQLRRPELDRSAEKREQIKIGIEGKALTTAEIRKNLSELELSELTDEIQRELDLTYPTLSLGNVVGEDIERRTARRLEAAHNKAKREILKLTEKL